MSILNVKLLFIGILFLCMKFDLFIGYDSDQIYGGFSNVFDLGLDKVVRVFPLCKMV